jgi:cadmium resistance protein CadD (predicted permease)
MDDRRVSPLALLLALISAVRPTSLAAVYAILHSSRPRRLLLIFDVSGLAVTLAIGFVFVVILHDVVKPSDNTHAGINIALALLCFAAALAIRRRPEHEDEHRSREATRRIAARLREPSVTTVAVAGVLTHFPGLFYLIALNAIIATDPSLFDGVVQVIVYNAIWFAIPLLALVLAILRPDSTSEIVERISEWARAHQRTVVPIVFVVLGLYLVAKGVTGF